MAIKNQPLFFLPIFLGLCAATWFFLTSGNQPGNIDSSSIKVFSAISLDSSNILLQKSDYALAEAALLLNQTDKSPSHVSQTKAEKEVIAWTTSDATTNEIPLPEAVSTYISVKLDMENPAYPAPGDQIKLVLPDAADVVAKVETTVVNPNGDYSWRGHIEGYGTDYPVVMTYGANSIFAMITTPQGSFTLESKNGSGWVYKNPSEFELSAANQKDYLEIPHLPH